MKKLVILTLAVMAFGYSRAQQTEWERSVQNLFDQARDLYDKQLYNPAKTKFEAVLATGVPQHTRWAEESSYYRAMCALFLMNKDAEELLEDFSLTYPASNLERKAALTAADYYFNKKDYKRALEWLQKVDASRLKGEEATEYFFKLGYAQMLNKQREDAKVNFLKVKENPGPDGVSAKYYYAHLAYEDSNYTTALANFEPLLNEPAFSPVVPYYLAQIYYSKGEYAKLIEYGEPLLARATEKRKPEIAKLLGEAYLKQDDYRKATEYLEMYKDKGGKMESQDYYSLGYAYYKTGRFAEAIQSFNKIRAGESALAQNAHYLLADCYLQTNNKTEAMAAFSAASKSDANPKIKEDAMFNYAKLSYELANPFGSAIAAFQEFLKLYPNSVKKEDANRYLASLYLTTKDYENALIAINNTGLGSKDMQEAYQKVSYFRGVQLYNANDLDKARTYFEQSLVYAHNQTYAGLARYWQAESFYKQGDYKNAMRQINAFENTPGAYNLTEAADARYTKGYIFFMQEDFASAITSFRLYVDNKRAAGRKKQDAELRLGDAYFMTNNYTAAISFYNKYLGYNLADADYALFQKALCLGLSGKREDKIAALDKLVKTYPKSRYAVDARYEQGTTLLSMDQNQEALSVFQKFVTDYPQSKHTSRAWLNIGLIYRNTEQYDKSISTFKKVVETYPATPEANEAIALARLVYARQNRIDEYVTWVEGINFANINRASLDSTSYNTAFDFYSAGNCTEAIKAFDGYVKKFPDGYFMVESNFYLGECAYKEKNDAVAERALERVISEPRSRFTERSINMLATINYVKPDYTKALMYYEQLLGFSEEAEQLRKARVGAMRSAVKLDLPNKALQYAEIILNDDRATPENTSEAMLVRARSYYKLDDVNAAHQAYEEIKNKAKGEPQAEACYYISVIQNKRAEYEKSNETIFWMIDKLPSYQKWRYSSLLVLADNYLQLEDYFQANYTLDFVIKENYSPEIVAEAQNLKALVAAKEANAANKTGQTEEE